MRITKTLAVATALSLTACALAQPTSHAEWREVDGVQIRRPHWPHPPTNLTLEGHRELFRDVVFVSRMRRNSRVEVQFYGSDGRYLRCNVNSRLGYFWREHSWKPIVVARRNGATPLLDVGVENPNRVDHLSFLYDGQTGELINFTRYKLRWWDWRRGHLQRRLPAVTWDLCPDFPSAEDLGMEINRAQTAGRYHELLEQDPGERILRPELMTPGAVRPYR